MTSIELHKVCYLIHEPFRARLRVGPGINVLILLIGTLNAILTEVAQHLGIPKQELIERLF